MITTYLALKWTVSRGQDTYGYNIVTLTDTTAGHRDAHAKFRAMGGGYDMTGTVFGAWLQTNYAAELAAIADRAHAFYGSRATPDGPFERTENKSPDALYGMTAYSDDDVEVRARNPRVRLDGACGLESMRRIATVLGLEVTATLTPRGMVTGFVVIDSVRS